jgi:hypothetical protein
VRNKLTSAAQALRDAGELLNAAIRDGPDDLTPVRDINQLTAREACTVLAALRLFQVIQRLGGELPSETRGFLSDGIRVADMEHFESEVPLSITELDALCERIAVDFTR